MCIRDRPEGAAPADSRPFESLLPLPELLADVLGASAASKRVQAAYFGLLKRLGPEFRILRECAQEEMELSLIHIYRSFGIAER